MLSAGALLAKGAALYTNTATQGAWTVYEAVGILGNVLVVVGLALLLVLAEQGGRPRDAADAPSLALAKFPLSTE